jgi:hypothetical protein
MCVTHELGHSLDPEALFDAHFQGYLFHDSIRTIEDTMATTSAEIPEVLKITVNCAGLSPSWTVVKCMLQFVDEDTDWSLS